MFIHGRNAHRFDDVARVHFALMGILRQMSSPVTGTPRSVSVYSRTKSLDVFYRHG